MSFSARARSFAGRRALTALALAAVSVALPLRPALADFVAPASLSATEGNQLALFSNTTGNTFQILWEPFQLSGLTVGETILGLRMRLNGGAGPNVAVSWASFDLSLGPSATPIGSPSFTFADNQGPGTVAVRSGPLAFDAGSFPSGGSPNGFGPLVGFSTPYTYTGGPLLLTASVTAASVPFSVDAGNATGTQLLVANVYNSPNATGVLANTTLVFAFATAAPEPGTLALIALGTVAGVAVRPRRRRG